METFARDRLAMLALCLIHGVGPKTRRSLLEFFGTAEAALAASGEQLQQVPGVGPKLAKAILSLETHEEGALPPVESGAGGDSETASRSRRGKSSRSQASFTRSADPFAAAEAELAACKELGVHLVLEGEPEYPAGLRTIPDPPGLLFIWGELLPEDAEAVAIVGSRHATRYGLTQAERLAASLAHAGYTIISGLARGIDAAAHRGALSVGGRTIAVLGGGLGKIYPPEHASLAAEIAKQGAVISEYPIRATPLASSFPQRNRIVSGMSRGVVVVEAALRSGALGTVQHALDQGREVFAVPGPIDSPLSQGCHRLIRDGAKLTECAEDVIDELRTLPPAGSGVRRVSSRSLFDLLAESEATGAESADLSASASPSNSAGPGSDVTAASGSAQGAAAASGGPPASILASLSEIERKVYDLASTEPRRVDDLIADSQLPAHKVLAAVGALEMRFLFGRLEGNRVYRK